jgi:hypothetical protein
LNILLNTLKLSVYKIIWLSASLKLSSQFLIFSTQGKYP